VCLYTLVQGVFTSQPASSNLQWLPNKQKGAKLTIGPLNGIFDNLRQAISWHLR
jgi:hypothetical protein